MSKYFDGIDKSAIEDAIEIAKKARIEGKELHEITAGAGKPKDHFVISDGEFFPLKALIKKAMELRGINPQDPVRREFTSHNGRAWLEGLDFKWIQLPHRADSIIRDCERYRKLQPTLARPNQAKFRAEAISLWRGVCPVTQCRTLPALEAAHIIPVGADGCDDPDNGILLRIDLHRLFDRDLMKISPEGFQVSFSSQVDETYDRFRNTTIKLPSELKKHSIARNLTQRYQLSL